MNQADFYTKLSKFQEILSSQDWTPDGLNDKQGYAFVSHKKIKRNVSKAILEAGLTWQISYSGLTIGDPIGTMKQHYVIEATARITNNANPSEFVEYHAYGEAADSGDKALSKAQTSGFKAIINNNFFIADIEAEGEEIIENNDAIKSEARSGYEAQQQIIRERVIKQFPDTPATTPAAHTQEGTMSESQKKVMDKILSKAKTMSETDLMPFGDIIQIESDYADVKTADDALKFITAYTGVLRCP